MAPTAPGDGAVGAGASSSVGLWTGSTAPAPGIDPAQAMSQPTPGGSGAGIFQQISSGTVPHSINLNSPIQTPVPTAPPMAMNPVGGFGSGPTVATIGVGGSVGSTGGGGGGAQIFGQPGAQPTAPTLQFAASMWKALPAFTTLELLMEATCKRNFA